MGAEAEASGTVPAIDHGISGAMTTTVSSSAIAKVGPSSSGKPQVWCTSIIAAVWLLMMTFAAIEAQNTTV